jgi:drug/metabolite transporter (DMT)-like permease
MTHDDRRPTSAGSNVLLAEVSVLGMALIWGVNFSVIKYGTTLVPALAYNGVRVALAALCLIAIALVFGARPSRRDAIAVFALGMLGNGIYQIFFAEGITRTRAGEAALVVGASPALMALFGRMLGVERITRRGAMGIGLSIFGVALVVLGRAAAGTGPQGGTLLGTLLVLCGSVCWAIYTVLLVPYTQRMSSWYVIALSMAGGATVLVTVGARAIVAHDWSATPTGAYVSMLYAGLGGLVIAYILWYRGVKVLGPTRTALYANLQPFIALMVAWFTLGETPRLWQIIGAVTIVGGVLLTRVPASEAP